jgi:hypothetical protein
VNVGLLLALILVGMLSGQELLGPENFWHFDANHYHVIQEKGYHPRNVAFFPLVPYVWRGLHLGLYGVMLLNALVYGLSAMSLAKAFKFNPMQLALACSLPSAFFLLIPYSEAFFFAFSVMVLLGLERRNVLLAAIGLFFCTLTRPAFTVFFPALLIVEWLQGRIGKAGMLRILAYATAMALGAVIVAWLQWLDTGQWFKYFSVQKEWGNFLQVPQLPFRTWGTWEALVLDAAALVLGLASMAIVLRWLWKDFAGTVKGISPALVFSVCYLAGMTFIVLLFRGGSLFSLNRFVFASPFAFLALKSLSELRLERLNWRHLLGAFLALEAFFVLFKSYGHLVILIRFVILGLYLLGLVALTSPQPSMRAFTRVSVLVIQFSYLVFATYCFLLGKWIA